MFGPSWPGPIGSTRPWHCSRSGRLWCPGSAGCGRGAASKWGTQRFPRPVHGRGPVNRPSAGGQTVEIAELGHDACTTNRSPSRPGPRAPRVSVRLVIVVLAPEQRARGARILVCQRDRRDVRPAAPVHRHRPSAAPVLTPWRHTQCRARPVNQQRAQVAHPILELPAQACEEPGVMDDPGAAGLGYRSFSLAQPEAQQPRDVPLADISGRRRI